jgi:phage terminase large subunit
MKRSAGGRKKLTTNPGAARARSMRAKDKDADAGGPKEKVIGVTRLFAETMGCKTRILVHQGGARAGKTYAIAQALVMTAIAVAKDGEHMLITIVRKRMPALKATAMKDVFEVLQDLHLYDERMHNKTDNTYQLGNVELEFISLDDPQKVRGRKRDILWLNEANELEYEDFKQLAMRTTNRIILDYNPSMEYHWIYDEILPRPDVTYVQSTYRDNPFLPEPIVREIERLKETDPVAWKVYGLGERGASVASIFPDFEVVDGVPNDPEDDTTVVYGLDFGYTSPSALVEVRILGDEMYLRELLYEPKLTHPALMRKIEALIPGKWVPIYCDSANSDKIDEMWANGFNAQPADKRPHSVRSGIDFMKRHRILVDAKSKHLIKEMRHYRWMTNRHDEVGEMPEKGNDHAIDAARYAAYTHWGKPAPWLMAEDIEDAVFLDAA